MVSDLAAVYGKTASLTKEHMVYCLFRHTAAQALRDVAVRVAQRSVRGAMARWLPVAGAMGVGAYAYFDTSQVGATAMELFDSHPAQRVNAACDPARGHYRSASVPTPAMARWSGRCRMAATEVASAGNGRQRQLHLAEAFRPICPAAGMERTMLNSFSERWAFSPRATGVVASARYEITYTSNGSRHRSGRVDLQIGA